MQELIDALSPGAFEALVRARLKAARKPGCVRVVSGQVLRAAAEAGNSFARFLRALRMGLGARGSGPKVTEALQLFAPGFRHGTMDDLLQIARKAATDLWRTRSRCWTSWRRIEQWRATGMTCSCMAKI